MRLARLRLRLLGLLLGLGLSLCFRPARATDWPSEGAIVNAILRIYLPWVYKMKKTVEDYTKAITRDHNDRTVTTWGVFGDSVRTTKASLYKAGLKRRSAPSPDICLTKSLNKVRGDTARDSAERWRLGAHDGDHAAADLHDHDVRAHRRYRISGPRHGGEVPDPVASAGSQLAQGYGADNPASLFKLIKRLLGQADDMVTVLQGKPTREGVAYEDLRAAHLSRLAIIRSALQRMAAERHRDPARLKTLRKDANAEQKKLLGDLATADGLSQWDVWRYHVAATYGSDSWHTQLAEAPNYKGVATTLAKVQATHNSLRFQLNEAMAERSRLLSIVSLESLGGPATQQRLQSAYTAAAKA